MNHSIEKSLYHLVDNGNLQNVTESEISTLTEKYPWFSVVHAIQSKKIKDTNSSNFLQKIQHTSLYFNNPLWLQYQLLTEKSFSEIIEEEKIILPVLDKVNQEEIEQLQQELQEVEISTTAETISDFIEEPISTDNIINPVILETMNLENELQSNIDIPKNEFHNNTDLEKEANDTEMKETTEEELVLPRFNYIPLTDEQLKNAELEIAVEPYHTIDYFDSQGIKVNLNEGKQDKLSHQLRCFTDWLKHMKAIGPEDALEAIKDPQLEATIQGIAEGSNASREIVTETMADVLVKQGKVDKAIQLYIKLSFLNPDKSPYFASKIQELKGISQ